MPNLWIARWPNNANPNSIDVQNINPPAASGYPNVYGVWNPTFPTIPEPQPWKFWQYASSGTNIPGILGDGGHHTDLDVAHGNIEYVKDFLVPAMWMSDTSGNWTTLSSSTWNSYNADPNQVGGASRLPAGNDTVIIDRPSAAITVTLGSGNQSVRKLVTKETLNITGGSLTVTYVPGSGGASDLPMEIAGAMTISGGALSAHTVQVDAGATLNISGGTTTLNTVNLVPHGSTPGKIVVGGNPTIGGLNGATATINSVAGAGQIAGSADLGAASRTITVNDGAANVDLAVNVPIVNGTLTKAGLGTMSLGATNDLTGQVTVNDGILLVTANSQLGTSGVVANMTVVTPGLAGHGGTLQLSGNVNYSLPMTIAGGGLGGSSGSAPGSTAALDNLSGANTWGGTITLTGAGVNGGDPLLNQIGATGGTLVVNGQIAGNASWAKTGNGDVVLGQGSANSYNGLTRVFGGRLIIEKDGALGTAGLTNAATGNTFQLAGSASTIAFRAPTESPGLNYSTFEWIHTSGIGAPGFGQIDNLSGNNVFNGSVGLGGPTVGGTIEAYLGVTSGSLEITGQLSARGLDAGVRNIHKSGGGELILSGDSASIPVNGLDVPLANSSFYVDSGTVTLKGTATNTPNVPGIANWNVAGNLAINKNAAAGIATINLTGGRLTAGASITIPSNIMLSASPPTLDSGANNASLSGSISGTTGITKTGAGSITLSGNLTGISDGPLNVSTGKLVLAPNGGNSRVAKFSSLSVAAGAALDISNNAAVVDYAGSSPVDSIRSLILAGRGGIGVGNATWTGVGAINSSAAAADADALSIGYGENSAMPLGAYSTFMGRSVDSSSVLVKLTRTADADLDGRVEDNDVTIVGAFYLQPNSGQWYLGDFDFSGMCDDSDVTLLGAFYDPAAPALSPAYLTERYGPEFAMAFAAGQAMVPEPSALALVGFAFFARRHRRRNVNRH
jgi:autotransporter-associated beta strand protein